jgi:hypothetical protein
MKLFLMMDYHANHVDHWLLQVLTKEFVFVTLTQHVQQELFMIMQLVHVFISHALQAKSETLVECVVLLIHVL